MNCRVAADDRRSSSIDRGSSFGMGLGIGIGMALSIATGLKL